MLIGIDSYTIKYHNEINEEMRTLRSEGLNMQRAFDGQQLPELPAKKNY